MSSSPPDPRSDLTALKPPIMTGLLGRCPRCAKGSMFNGFLALAETCPVCGFDLRSADPGDGPAFFASFISGPIILGVAVWLQIAYEPPFWVYPIIFAGGIVLCLGLLRLLKGLLVALQFANKAEQGRPNS